LRNGGSSIFFEKKKGVVFWVKEVKTMNKISHIIMIAFVVTAVTLMYSAVGMAASMPTGEFAGASIEKGSANGVTYQTGGVGIEERAAMDHSIHAYNLRLVFANTKGWDLSSIPVQIKAADGKVVLNQESSGPWFWVNLPPGTYEVAASYNKQTEVHKVEVGKTPQSVEFTWNQVK
jgi:hypothetical protein